LVISSRTSPAVALPDTHLAPVQARYRQILAERARMQRVTLRDQLLDAFARDQQQGLRGTAVDLRMRPGIAADSCRRYLRFGNRPLGDSSR
jgi:hypothetical protein